MYQCETENCENIPYSNPEFNIRDRFCYECAWKAYHDSKPFDHDWGD